MRVARAGPEEYYYVKLTRRFAPAVKSGSEVFAETGTDMRKVVLIADDSKLYHKMYEEILSPEYDILHAYDGVEALETALAHLPDAIILDIIMPKMDGRAVCRKLREDPRTKLVKIAMLTARDTQFDRLVGLEVGADEYIEKPCTPGCLKIAVDKLFRKV